jgi:hypothetical protein
MNEKEIYENTEILGTKRNYKPNDVVFHTDKNKYLFKNCIVVFSYLKGAIRVVFKVKYYESFTPLEFNETDNQHFAHIIYCKKKESESIIEDINGNLTYRD